MRAATLVVPLILSFALASGGARADVVDVVVQAGHQGRPESCAPNHVHACNMGTSNGTDREIVWTPIVADAAAAALRKAGYRVVRRPADYPEHDVARIYVAIHFDGADPPCASGASVGFPATTPIAFVHAWEHMYRPVFPFRFSGENISTNEERYYGFKKVDAPMKILIEYGELTCPAQAAWMRPRLQELGQLTARFATEQLR